MNYRTAIILAAQDLVSASGTKTIDLNISDIISRIIIRWQVTKSISYMNSYAHSDILKIELVDGSDVLHSLNGGQNQALCIYDRKVPTMLEGGIIGANAQISHYGIDFGRFLFDPVLAFDPKQFRNPQLKITYNEALSDTGNEANELEIWAECFDEKVVSPMGFLSAKEHHSYTPASSGVYEYIQLPTDRVIRKMLIQGYLADHEPWYQVAEAKLDEDNDKRIPFDWNLEKYYQVRKSRDLMVMDSIATQLEVTARAYYLTPTDYWAGLILQNTDPSYSAGVPYVGAGGVFSCSVAGGGGTENNGISHGWLPNHCFQFPFGDQQDMADWYDATKVGSLRLRLKSGGGYSGSDIATVIQQLRSY